MIRYLSLATGVTGLAVAVLAAVLFMGRDSTANAADFFQPCGTLNLASTAANAPSDIKGNFGLGLDPTTCAAFTSAGHTNVWNSGGLIYFTPKDWTVAKATDVDVGAKVGTFKSKAILGVFDNGCQTVLPVDFDLFNGTIVQTPTVDELPALNAAGQPQADRLSPMKDADGNGVPDVAEKWPSYLNDVATKIGFDLTQLHARFIGVNTKAVTGTTVVLNFLVFEPGAKVSNRIVLDPALGYPTVTILQDPSQAGSPKDPVSDFCAPLWTEQNVNGQANGKTFRGNPKDGKYNFITYVAPANDADNDGIENSLDPCPLTPNDSGWDPRVNGKQDPGDKDGDGLPDDCDPFPLVPSTHNALNGISNSDEDGDGWQNRGDNCPLIPNGLNEANTAGVGNQTDTDGDGIGDACDPHPTINDGQNAPVCLVSTVTIGSGGAEPANPQALAPCDPNATVPVPGQPQATAQPTPTFIPGTTNRPTNAPVTGGGGGGGGVGGGPVTGIGSLAPEGTSIPAWAAMLAALGAIGLAFGVGMMGTQLWRRRD